MEDMEIAPGAVQTGQSERGQPEKKNCSRRTEDWVDLKAVDRMSFWTRGSPDSLWGIRLNPVTSIATTVVVWTFVLVCVIAGSTDNSHVLDTLSSMKTGITKYFTWLYVATQQCWFVFILVVFYKYGHLKLGKDTDVPEYDNASWFMMLFAAGVGVGLFYFGVSEPVSHYKVDGNRNRHSYEIADERAQMSMNLTWYHWGVHAWVVYTIVGATMALVGYRKGLPITMRSCFYPVLGERAFGVIGDSVDVLSAVCTLFGVCTSLGLGVIDLSTGLVRITGCASMTTESVCASHSGACKWESDWGVCKSVCDTYFPKGGATNATAVKCNADEFCLVKHEAWPDKTMCSTNPETDPFVFTGSSLPLLLSLIWIISAIASVSVVTGVKLGIRALSILCFSVGMFLMTFVFFGGGPWYFLDIFTQQFGLYFQSLLQVGSHTDAYARHSQSVKSGITEDEGADANWMDAWTMFYWGWWIAWCPFVGMFIAKISRGRTLRQFILGTLTAPALYGFSWFTVFGGDAIMMERQAEQFNITGFDSPAYRKISIHGNSTEPCTRGTEKCQYFSRISNLTNERDAWSDMIIRHSPEFGPVLLGISLFAMTLYFITSSDSGSLVVDALCSNGRGDSPALQKIYWAATQGATATALVIVGMMSKEGSMKNVLEALQSTSIASGLPYTIMICFMCSSLWKACRYENGDEKYIRSRFFRSDLFNVFDVRYTREWQMIFFRTLHALVYPVHFLRIPFKYAEFSSKTGKILLYCVGLLFYLVPIFLLLGCFFGSWALILAGWWYLCFVILLSTSRHHLRTLKNLDGNFLEDFFACFCMYAIAVEQLDAHFRIEGAGKPEEWRHDGVEKAESADIDSRLKSTTSSETLSVLSRLELQT